MYLMLLKRHNDKAAIIISILQIRQTEPWEVKKLVKVILYICTIAGILYAGLSNYEPKSEFYTVFPVAFENLVRDEGDKNWNLFIVTTGQGLDSDVVHAQKG